MSVTFENIRVEPFPFITLYDVQILQEPNRHPLALVKGLIDAQKANDIMLSADPGLLVRIFETAEGKEQTLFFGVITEIRTSEESGNCNLHLVLTGTSVLLDLKKGNKSFQNLSKTYTDILEETVGDDGRIITYFEDGSLAEFEVRYRETQWEFLKKMSMKLDACLLPECTAKEPQIHIGVPDIPSEQEFSPLFRSKSLLFEEYMKSAENGGTSDEEDFSCAELVSLDFELIGRKVSFDGQSLLIKTAHSYFDRNRFVTKYRLAKEAAFAGNAAQNAPVSYAAEGSEKRAGAELPAIRAYARVREVSDTAKKSDNEKRRVIGRMFYGTVVAVKKDKLKVHITDMDKSADASASKWFPYASPYAPADGSGWYVMPEIGDTVRVYFPGNDPKKAFACSSLGNTGKGDPAEKSWQTPAGKEILMNKQGVYLINKAGAMMIEMTDEGVSLTSDNKIKLKATGEITVVSESKIAVDGSDIALVGGGSIEGGSGTSEITLSNIGIGMVADNIYSN
jgi:hypothetical protein